MRRPLRALVARRQSLRTRVTVVAALAITTAIVLGLLLMYLLQMNSVRRTIDGQLRTYTTQISQSAVNGNWPQPLPLSSLDANAEAQVIAADGHVLAATRTLAGLPPVYQLPAGSTTPVRQKAADGVIPTDIRVVGMRVIVAGQPVTILAGTSTGLLHQVSASFVRQLLIGLPIILVLAAVTVWLVVGRALRPVERIRHAVTDITSADLSRRVPEPATNDEVGQLAHTMNDMLARLDAAARKQRRFVADASHELRSPLAAIRTTLEVGLAHPDKAPWPVIAQRAAGQSARLEELITQLLMLAKADESQLTSEPQRVDLDAMLGEVRAAITATDRQVHIHSAPGAVTTGNPEHLERLLRNVIDNALRHARTDVAITISHTTDSVRIDIDDDGDGIPAADRDRVFDRFVRLDTSRERGSGTTGLGLSIAREIATAHHGSMHISDSPLGGTRMTVLLPQVD